MPNNNVSRIGSASRGKPGTITADEFNSLSSMASQYGAKLLASKVAKICLKKADLLSHEYANSRVATAYYHTAEKISAALNASGNISNDSFKALSALVDRYGAEVVTQKLAKVARRMNSSDASTLKAIFPKISASAPAADADSDAGF